MEDIAGSCHKALDTLDTLLSVELIDLGVTALERTQLPLDSFLTEAIGPCFQQASAAGLTFEFDTVDTNHKSMTELSNVIVNVDKKRMTQAIRLLLDNAFKYTPKHGKVTVSVDHVQHSPDALSQQYYRVVVTDTGRGMTQDQLSSLFKESPFKHLSSGTAASGVGLWSE